MYIDGIYLKRSWGASYENVAVMIAIGINQGGYREIIGCAEGFTESKESWCEFLVRLKSRRLKGVRMITGNKLLGMLSAIEETFPQARYQRCTVHFYRNVFGKVSQRGEDDGGDTRPGKLRGIDGQSPGMFPAI